MVLFVRSNSPLENIVVIGHVRFGQSEWKGGQCGLDLWPVSSLTPHFVMLCGETTAYLETPALFVLSPVH